VPFGNPSDFPVCIMAQMTRWCNYPAFACRARLC
jgi:hypothetical protein